MYVFINYCPDTLLTDQWVFSADLAAPDMVKFGIESKFSSPLTSTEKFKEAITEAMEEMYIMCEDAQREGDGLHSQVSSHL